MKLPHHLLLGTAFAALLASLTSAPLTAQDEEKLSVFEGWMRFTDAPNSLYHHVAAEMQSLLAERKAAVSELRSEAEWRERREEVRATLKSIVGPFPERTPLNPRITGTTTRNGIRMEKVVFESQPGFYVTGAVFIPEGLAGPAPGVLYLSGHAAEAFRSRAYMHIIQNLALKGFVVFAIDPVGQGERLQHWDEEAGRSWIGGSTLEHSYPGAQCFVSGSSLARLMTWDAIRAIDYLVTREEVDPERIGVNGRSGGGTQTAYVSAFDERVLASAPENYITSFQRLIESRGLQDAEQNFPGGIAHGIDMADLLLARAPAPTLVLATTRDIFNIEGTREVYDEILPAFSALGAAEHLVMVEDDAGHTSTLKNREALYAFFQEYLDLPGDPGDLEVEEWPADELQVTESGQLATSLGGETVFSLNRAETQPLLERLEESRADLETHLGSVVGEALRLSGWRDPGSEVEAVFTGRWPREGYSVETWFLEGEGDYAVPFLLFVPDGAAKLPATIYLHPESKAEDAAVGGPIEALVRQGRVVLAPDLPGMGETGPGVYRGDAYGFRIGAVSYNLWFAGVQTGRSLTGIRAAEVARCIAFLRGHEAVDAEAVGLVALEDLATVGLHAAAFDLRIAPVVLTAPLVSWADLVSHQRYRTYYMPHTVPGALASYDLPDLAATLAPRALTLINPANHAGEAADAESLEREYGVLRNAYAAAGAEGALRIRSVDEEEVAAAVLEAFSPGER